MIGLYGISFWLPTIVKAFGVKGYLNTGLITAIPYAVAVVGMIFLSRSSDRTGERRLHYVINVTVGGIGLILSGIFAANPVLAIVFLSIGTLGVIGSMPLFWPVPSTFLAGTAAAAGIGVVNSVGNLGGYIGPNLPIWIKRISPDPSAALYAFAGILFVGAFLAYVYFPRNLPGQVSPDRA
jgi:MFS family permease